ncbi:MAG TPA: LLM class flavin-dependent oxidoreductase [Candidatus Limnocylindrales bacterium]|jgi:alkanesulfonate monooxygenase SsuD/methylene tetrahydromethanopterin reductase-like flavin-dependent oxidoreductase (luciferase family)
MRVGIQLPEVERVVRWPEYVAMAQAAEQVGFDTLWLGDHLLYRYEDGSARGPWEVWTALAAIAASTTRIRLGPLVAATAFHAPAMLAKMAATVDEISGGRLIVGLGAGWNETEFAAFGFPFDHRISRFEESFTIIRTLLAGGRIDFDGQFFQARDCELLPPPARPGGPPLMVGSIGPRMLEITLPHVQQWNVWYRQSNNSPGGLAPILKEVDDVCRAVGRDPATLEKTSAVLVRLQGGSGRVMGDTSSASTPPLEGSPSEIAAGLREYADLGLAEVQLVVDPITLESIHALAPVLAELDRG